jgi:ABC-type sugar transport system ATPase subunit
MPRATSSSHNGSAEPVGRGDIPRPVLEVRGLSKSFGSVRALQDVDWELRPGEIHALLGENGAGKSTLIRILAGDHVRDAGELLLDGAPVAFAHPQEALAAGIAFVHQIPAFVPSLSITENLRLGLPPERRGLIDWRAEHAAAAAALAEVGVHVDPRTRLEALGPHERQLVALARGLARHPRVLVLDEITAPLTEPEVELLHGVVRGLRDRGVAIVYVSHRLEEVLAIADRVTVLRDGRRVATEPMAGLTRRRLAELIVGRDVDELFARDARAGRATSDEPLLTVDRLGRDGGVSLTLRAGEIVGLAGLAGSGRSRLLRCLFGAQHAEQGEMLLGGEPYAPRHPADAIGAGVGMVTEERLVDGFVDQLTVGQNITLPWLARFRRHGLLRLRQERTAATRLAERLRVRTPSVTARMAELSGGNQQKAILARWTAGDLRVLLLDEPTHGVDIGSKAEIYAIVREHAARGVGVVVASSELEELEALCDRVLLLRAGRAVGELRAEAITKEAVLHGLLLNDHEDGGPRALAS